VCERCAESCDALDGMEGCAAVCRRCASHCREMAAEGISAPPPHEPAPGRTALPAP
jgi:hypothetical protein